MKLQKHIRCNTLLAFLTLMALPVFSFAQENDPPTVSYFTNALFNTLLVTIILLAALIVALSNVLKNISGSDLLINLLKTKEKKSNSGSNTLSVILFFTCLNLSAFAQESNAILPIPSDDGRIGGIDQFTFYFLLTLIVMEVIVTGILIYTIRFFLKTETPEASAIAKPKEKTIFDKLGGAVEIEREESILLDHDYDGIKELDNDLPPWWKYGFYLTIVVAVIYLVNYHVIKNSPLQAEEYAISVKRAEAEIAEFMKTSANNVDESTVKQLTEASDIATGKDLFEANCSACHGKSGEGTVGPNLTDDYWLHSGGIKDVFKTIKYGWPDKGMKAWKDDFSPMQIAQLASYIKTLRGTNPLKPKEKQGDLYIEDLQISPDSTMLLNDSLIAVSLTDSLQK